MKWYKTKEEKPAENVECLLWYDAEKFEMGLYTPHGAWPGWSSKDHTSLDEPDYWCYGFDIDDPTEPQYEFGDVMRAFERWDKMPEYNGIGESAEFKAYDQIREVQEYYRGMMWERCAEIIMKWSAEHPRITNEDKFVDVFGEDIGELNRMNPVEFQEWCNREYEKPEDE